MSGRLLLGGFALAVSGALVFLVVSASSSPSGKSESAHKGGDEGSGIVAEAQAAERAQEVPRRMAGEVEPEDSVRPDTDTGEVREYIRSDGRRTRDHRGGDHVVDPDRVPYRRKKRGKVSPDVIVAVRRALRPHVRKCSDDYADDVGADAKVDVRLTVSITDGVVTVDKVIVNPKNVSGRDLLVCVEQAVRNMELTHEHDEDVEHHMLTFPFGLPVK